MPIKKRTLSEALPSLTELIKDNIGMGGQDNPGLSYSYVRLLTDNNSLKVDANDIPAMVKTSAMFIVQTLSGSTNLPENGQGLVLNINRQGGSLITVTQMFMTPIPYIRHGILELDYSVREFSEWRSI